MGRIDKKGKIAIFNLEDKKAFNVFKQGLEDRRFWQKHPETTELASFLANNREFPEVYVKAGDSYLRVD